MKKDKAESNEQENKLITGSASGDSGAPEKLPSDQSQQVVPEISEEDKIDRAATTLLIFQRTKEEDQEFLKRRKKRREEEVELLDGSRKTLEEYCRYVVSKKGPYTPLFPNSVPFFELIFKLNGWNSLNPHSYSKPPKVAKWIKELIYQRFALEVLPALMAKNPLLPSGFRKYKLSEYLDEEGQAKVIQFRDEAIVEMQASKTWGEFRERMYVKYGVPYQKNLFD